MVRNKLSFYRPTANHAQSLVLPFVIGVIEQSNARTYYKVVWCNILNRPTLTFVCSHKELKKLS